MSEPMTDEQLNKLATIRWEQPGLVVSGFDATAEIRQLRRELAEAKAERDRLRIKTNNSLANNLCPDHRDKQRDKSCLACEIDRLQSERDAARRECESWKQAVETVYTTYPAAYARIKVAFDRIRREAEGLLSE